MYLNDHYENFSSISLNEMIYPTYTEKDINITKWPGGKHYYARIGNMQVMDENGDTKWNTYERAFEVAKKYL
jgi:hypothetical protein